jgi:hypothetical protein
MSSLVRGSYFLILRNVVPVRVELVRCCDCRHVGHAVMMHQATRLRTDGSNSRSLYSTPQVVTIVIWPLLSNAFVEVR